MLSVALNRGEVVLHEEGGSHYHNFIAVGGTLTLTNQRIVFQSNQNLAYTHELILELNAIDHLDFFKTMFLNPNGLAILKKDGTMENFIVDDRKSWSERIQSAMQKHVNV